MKLPINAALRAQIQRQIELARSHRCDFRNIADQSDALKQLDRYAMMITPQVRVHFLHHALTSGHVLAHLAIHVRSPIYIDDEMVDQLAGEFGLGPRTTWEVRMNHPPLPSAHVFKRMNA